MAYKALYRSYRPTKFSEVIGQKHVIQTLKNAIKEDKTSHAYVFSGLRGIGKTTIARILAKAVNCENPIDGEPCNCCASCKAISESSTTDIVELDAASNNGVDEIRGILDRVNFLPSMLKKKVYIIDEVHMLSTAAFNALLKTLEEPPAYVMFIFATTEPHKIPNTILSRCQRFDFKQLTTSELIEELSMICQKENIKITQDALKAIAVAAEGGMRDALSILDQASVYAASDITTEDINSITGNVSNEKILELIKAFNADDATAAIDIVNELLNMGKEVSRLTTCVIQFCRDLLLYKSINKITSERYIYDTATFAAIAEETSAERLFYYIDVLMDVQNKIRFTNSQKIYLEVGVMKIVNGATNSLNLLSRIENIEQTLASDGVQLTATPQTTLPPQSDAKISSMEKKIRNIEDRLQTIDINVVKEQLQNRIAVIEEKVTSAQTSPIEDRLTSLENSLNNTNNVIVDDNITSKIENIETEVAKVNNKNNELLTALVEEVEQLKEHMNNSSTIVADDNNIQTTDDIVLELMEKVEQLEKTTDIQSINKELENVNNNINSINEQIIELKDGKKEISVSTNDTQLETFIQEFDALKEKVSNVDYNETLVKQINDLNNKIEDINIKLAAPSPMEEVLNKEETLSPDDTIYNKEIIEPDTNDVPYDNLNAILEHLQVEIDVLESKIKEINNNDVDSKINDLKTNYYVLASAIKPINDNITTLSNRLSIVETNTSITSAIDSIKDDIVVINKKLDDFNKDIQNINAKEEQKVVVESIPVQPQPCEIKQTTTIEPTISKEKETDVTAQNDLITGNKTEEETTVQDITHKIYDVKIVENILHESRTASCRSEKERLLNDWPKLEDKVGGLLLGTAKNLASGTLVANGNTHLLIVYEYAQICNQLMEPKRHKDALEILKVTFNRDYDFIALPDNTWKEKRLEYHNQYNIGNKYPTLTPINNPQLKIVEAKADKALTEHQKIVKKFDDMFGVTDEEE